MWIAIQASLSLVASPIQSKKMMAELWGWLEVWKSALLCFTVIQCSHWAHWVLLLLRNRVMTRMLNLCSVAVKLSWKSHQMTPFFVQKEGLGEKIIIWVTNDDVFTQIKIFPFKKGDDMRAREKKNNQKILCLGCLRKFNLGSWIHPAAQSSCPLVVWVCTVSAP